ncbi:MAG: PTS sugar transporter subunit IIA [Opitutae bacterium]|nr:PTS sugar transporter subunit IIA [Opitutae bacterium]
MPHRTLTLDELADHLHVERRHVERLVREGGLPHQKRGGRLVFPRAAVDAWASPRLLGLPAAGLAWYHRQTQRGLRAIFPAGALLPELMAPAHIDLALPAKTKSAAIRAMVALADKTGRVHDARELRASVEARETLGPTAVPGGLALLHPRTHEAYRFDGSFVVLGRTVQPVPFGAPDGRATRLFFLLCCDDGRLRLPSLARLRLLGQQAGVLAQLSAATAPLLAYDALASAEQKLLGAEISAGKS